MNIIGLISLLILFIFTDLISSVNSQAPDQQNNQDNSSEYFIIYLNNKYVK